jgi:hypothetical protein
MDIDSEPDEPECVVAYSCEPPSKKRRTGPSTEEMDISSLMWCAGKDNEKKDDKKEEKKDEKKDDKKEEKKDDKRAPDVSLIFFIPPHSHSRGSDDPMGSHGPFSQGPQGPDEWDEYTQEDPDCDKYDCDKSDCDHEDYYPGQEYDEKDLELKKITKVNNINDLIKLGELYHCKRRQTYMGIDLKRLHKLRSPLGKLNRMIGLKNIKENIVNQIVYFLSGLQDGNDDMMHTIIEGPPGCGKTEVGRILGDVYMSMGLLEKNVFRIVKRSELIGKYLGHTSRQTQSVIDSCSGGVMFIDEAYSLGDNEGRDSFSKECLDTLNQNLSDNKGKFLCIIAGYTDALDRNFFAFNEGLRRRFTFKYVIDKYTHDELRDIFLLKVREMGWKIASDVHLDEFFKENYEAFPHYGGDMETLFLNIRICHGRRIFCLDKEKNRKILNNEDFKEGFKVFSGHRKINSEAKELAKMKEYSMYL